MSRVTGYRETARALRKVAQRPKVSVGPASRKALAPMLAASKRNLQNNGHHLRYGVGVLKRSMRIRRLKATTTMSQYVVAPTGRGVNHAHLIEAGVRPHWQPKRGILHPGHQAWPFLEPAFFAHDDDVIRIMAKEFGAELIRYASHVAYRAPKT